MPDGICAAEGCPKSCKSGRYCTAHWSRLSRTGSLGTTPIRSYGLSKPNCSAPDCDSDAAYHGMCDKHATRVRRNGYPDLKPNRGEDNHEWRGDDVGYVGAHIRVRKVKGTATQYACTECGQPAKQWAYDHTDPNEKLGVNHGYLDAYSTDPERYRPMCVPCHKRLDLAHGPARKVTV